MTGMIRNDTEFLTPTDILQLANEIRRGYLGHFLNIGSYMIYYSLLHFCVLSKVGRAVSLDAPAVRVSAMIVLHQGELTWIFP